MSIKIWSLWFQLLKKINSNTKLKKEFMKKRKLSKQWVIKLIQRLKIENAYDSIKIIFNKKGQKTFYFITNFKLIC